MSSKLHIYNVFIAPTINAITAIIFMSFGPGYYYFGVDLRFEDIATLIGLLLLSFGIYRIFGIAGIMPYTITKTIVYQILGLVVLFLAYFVIGAAFFTIGLVMYGF